MPASDVKAWAKAATKPSYDWSEINNMPDTLDVYRINAKSPWKYGYATPSGPVATDGGRVYYTLSGVDFTIGDEDHIYNNNEISKKEYRNIFTFHVQSSPFASKTCFYPNVDDKSTLGLEGYRWADIYCTNSTITTSDKNQKKDISYIGQDSGYDNTRMDDDTLVKLILGLKPVIYTRIDADSNRPHHGIVSQDFEELLKKLGIKDHAAFIKSPKTKAIEIEEEVEKEAEEEVTNEDGTKQIVKRTVKETQTRIEYEEIPGEYTYGMRYEELFGDNVRFSQILWYKIMEQEKIIQEQQEEINGLKARFEILEAKIK